MIPSSPCRRFPNHTSTCNFNHHHHLIKLQPHQFITMVSPAGALSISAASSSHTINPSFCCTNQSMMPLTGATSNSPTLIPPQFTSQIAQSTISYHSAAIVALQPTNSWSPASLRRESLLPASISLSFSGPPWPQSPASASTTSPSHLCRRLLHPELGNLHQICRNLLCCWAVTHLCSSTFTF